ncbi:unnamed protein product [Linum tenue]|uniref:Zinc finger PHD-type domain-containing protein n=1 Tax=Linum tenue TaxID=586396 RepID=A0AAV0IUB9_9ROSI|nr:unnamed protein product [Linum tenue]
MLIPILDVCRKRKRNPKCFDFHSFGDPCCSPIAFTGPFRDNIRIFVNECAEPEDYEIEGMPIWCTLLTTSSSNNNVVLPLYTVEDEESVHPSQNPLCDRCKCTGWGNNFVSKRKYHIIIPVHSDWNRKLEEGALDLESHLLHGLIHCNGFGHLLRINGIEGGGSRHLSGREIMDLWDRICGSLRARSISVEDVSKKRSMDLRLLYGVAYGHSWFGRWGYKFGRGSFGVTGQGYNRALEAVASLQLDPILTDFDSKGHGGEELKRIVRFYRDLCRTQLTNLGELLRFMLDLKSCRCGSKKEANPNGICSTPSRFPIRVPPLSTGKKGNPRAQNRCRKFSSVIATLDSRWSARRMEFAAAVIVEALQQGKTLTGGGMSRQQVRDAARMHVGDTGLLDYVLKSMNNVAVGDSVIRRAVNPRTRILEYSIADLRQEEKQGSERKFQERRGIFPGIDLYTDMSYLYENVLVSYPDSELVDIATLTVLDSKHFVKEWPWNDRCDQLLRLLFRVDTIDGHRKQDFSEIVVLPPDANMVELKQAAEEALRDTYATMEDVEVIEVKGMEDADDDQSLSGEIEPGSEIVVKVAVTGGGKEVMSRCGSGSDEQYEGGGADNWRVKCECGARDDDGERMVACDVCEVWHHTRCVGIDDSEKAPPLFVCSGCCVALGGEEDGGGGRVEMIDLGTSVDDMLMIDGDGFEYGAYLLF